jgi:hypothetical protein
VFKNEIIKCLLSHKYGSRFLPSKIIKEEYEILKNILKENREIDCSFKIIKDETEYNFKNLFEDCYQLNQNETPACYRIKSLLIFFNTNSEESYKVRVT